MKINMIVAAFIAAGGLGFINYYIADRLDLIDFNKSNSNIALPFMLLWSVFDFAIYLIIQSVLRLIPIFKDNSQSDILIASSLIATIFFILLFFSKYANSIFKWINNLINQERNLNGYADKDTASTWKKFISHKNQTIIYIYNLDGSPIIAGFVEDADIPFDGDFGLSIIPFEYDGTELEPLNDLIAYYTDKEGKKLFKVIQYIDINRKMIFVNIEKLNPS